MGGLKSRRRADVRFSARARCPVGSSNSPPATFVATFRSPRNRPMRVPPARLLRRRARSRDQPPSNRPNTRHPPCGRGSSSNGRIARLPPREHRPLYKARSPGRIEPNQPDSPRFKTAVVDRGLAPMRDGVLREPCRLEARAESGQVPPNPTELNARSRRRRLARSWSRSRPCCCGRRARSSCSW